MDCLMEQQQAALEVTQVEELKAERDRWAAALEASERQITHLTDKAAALEKTSGPWSLLGGLALSPESGDHEGTGDGNGDPGGEGCKYDHGLA